MYRRRNSTQSNTRTIQNQKIHEIGNKNTKQENRRKKEYYKT